MRETMHEVHLSRLAAKSGMRAITRVGRGRLLAVTE